MLNVMNLRKIAFKKDTKQLKRLEQELKGKIREANMEQGRTLPLGKGRQLPWAPSYLGAPKMPH